MSAHIFWCALFFYFCRMSDSKTIAPVVLKVLLGLMFVVSAILKLISIDQFEIYVYSYHFFSLNFSFLVARAAIILEFVLGIWLISNYLHKLMWWGSVAMLGAYTLLLIYALFLGRTDNCHCFGELLPFNPKQSLVKNVVLMALFLLVYRMKGKQTPFRWFGLIVVALTATIAVFVVSPPDNYTDAYNPENQMNTELFHEALMEPPLDSLGLTEGKQVVCFFSTGCEYCQMAVHKLSLMQQFYGFPAENITCIFLGSEEGMARFFEQSESERYRSLMYKDVVKLLKISNGNLPLLVFLENGEVAHEYGFRNMREAEIKAFFED